MIFGSLIEDPRQLSPEQRLAAHVLREAAICLQRRLTCERRELALAWVLDRYSCNCPFEGRGLEFATVAALLGQEAEFLRAVILRDVAPAPPRPLCRRTQRLARPGARLVGFPRRGQASLSPVVPMGVKIHEKNRSWWLYVGAALLAGVSGALRAESIQEWRTPTGTLYFGDHPPSGLLLGLAKE
jgi:hypothetical protein